MATHSSILTKAYRERSADHAKQEKQIETLNAELIKQRAAYAELSRKYRTELQSTEKMVSSNSTKMNELSASALRMRWPKYWSFSFSIIPSKEHPELISFRMDWLDDF